MVPVSRRTRWCGLLDRATFLADVDLICSSFDRQFGPIFPLFCADPLESGFVVMVVVVVVVVLMVVDVDLDLDRVVVLSLWWW